MNAPQKAADASMYSVSVLEHFKNPRNAGELENADANVEVTNPVCGDTMRLSARLKDGRIAEAKFLARGCVTSIACGSLVAEKMHGCLAGGNRENYSRANFRIARRTSARNISRRATGVRCDFKFVGKNKVSAVVQAN
jgi:hypothetical protein